MKKTMRVREALIKPLRDGNIMVTGTEVEHDE